MAQYPKIFRVRQHFPRQRVDDVPAAVHQQLAQLNLERRIRPGQRVAITAGSRGIVGIDRITRAIVQWIQRLQAQPFIVPAMGSHGGGTAEGQLRVLEGYGITESFCGCPIRSTMETVVVCHTEEGIPVHFDRFAMAADHVVVCNRVKPHTELCGTFESGLMKMMLIGLGKHRGATIYHAAFQDYGFDRIVQSVAGQVLRKCRIAAGVAIVENAYDETARIEAVAPEDFAAREAELLQLARQWLPRLPFVKVDVLLLDQIGKDISGAGLDTNVVGRKAAVADGTTPRVKRIVARDLTAASHGNAIGIGMADFCLARLAKKIDSESTRINGVTSGRLEAARVPITLESDRDILDSVLQTIGLTPPEDARLLWIRNTLDVQEVECSAAYLAEAQGREDLEILRPPSELPLDDHGHLPRSMTELARTKQ